VKVAFLQGVFAKVRVLSVFFLWRICGGLRVKRGALMVAFSSLKKPLFSILLFTPEPLRASVRR
jgi:hypothetical protein